MDAAAVIPSEVRNEERESKTEIAVVQASPLLSVVVPVFNGSSNIESTLNKIKSQIEKLDTVVSKLAEDEDQRAPLVNTGRNIIGNASAALLLDQYLSSTAATALASGLNTLDNSQKEKSHSSTPWYEIVVVNDGSKDATRSIVRRMTSADSTIRLISYSVNMGKGYAVKQGVLHSRGKYVMFLDGDGEINTELLARFLEQMAGADLVIGSKYHPQSVVNTPISRRFWSKCFQVFVRLMLKTNVSDTQVGLKMGKGDAFRKIFQQVVVRRYAFDVEMLTIASILGLKVAELPVQINQAKPFSSKEIVRMGLDVMGIAFRSRVINWYQKNMGRERPYYNPLMFA
jgi:dolichol-phosphate mannosyltransferase